jgi:hypothetical protein
MFEDPIGLPVLTEAHATRLHCYPMGVQHMMRRRRRYIGRVFETHQFWQRCAKKTG